MESHRQILLIADYSVSQTTLDQVFINFAKSSTNQDDSDAEDDESVAEDDIDEEDEEVTGGENGEDSIFENELDAKKEAIRGSVSVEMPPLDGISPIGGNNNNSRINSTDQFDVNNTNRNINDTPTFEAIKNHFNSLKKTRHIRKTSSAKSQDFKQSQRSRRSQRSRSASIKQRKSITEQGVINAAYESDYKSGDVDGVVGGMGNDGLDMPIQESSHDLTMSITEDGEYYSRC
jgi:hypothetical protein